MRAIEANDFENVINDLRQTGIKLKMNGRAYHTTTTGCGKNRRTTSVTTWSGDKYATFSGSTDLSEDVNKELIRNHPLVCITFQLKVQYKDSQIHGKVDEQYQDFVKMVA